MYDGSLFTIDPALPLALACIEPKPFIAKKERRSLIFHKQLEAVFVYGVEIWKQTLEQAKQLSIEKLTVILLEEDVNKIKYFFQQFEIDKLKKIKILICSAAQTGSCEELLQKCAKYLSFEKFHIICSSSKQNASIVKKHLQALLFLKRGYIAENLYENIVIKNTLENLPLLSSAKSLTSIQNSCKNMPAIICGAGPSLKSSFDYIKEHKNHAFIFAGGSAISALHKHDIKPHFEVAVDPTELEYKIIKGAYPINAPFCTNLRSFPLLKQLYNGPIVLNLTQDINKLQDWICEKLEIKNFGYMQGGLTVASECLNIAIELGCNPIVLTGIDLCYQNNTKYVEGVACPQSLEQIKDELIPYDNKLTNTSWVLEKDSIESKIKANPDVVFYNTSSIGLTFEGAAPQSWDKLQCFEQQFNIEDHIHTAFASAPFITNKDLNYILDEIKNSVEEVVNLYQKKEKGEIAQGVGDYFIEQEIAYELLFDDMQDACKQISQECFSKKNIDQIIYKKAQSLLEMINQMDRL